MPFLRGKRQSPRAAEAMADDAEPVAASSDRRNSSKVEGKRPGGLYATLSNSFRRVAGNKPSEGTKDTKEAEEQLLQEGEPVFDTQESDTDEPLPPRRRIKKKKALVLDTSDNEDDDPVMAVFEARARATARVRFATEPQVQGEETKKPDEKTGEEATDDTFPIQTEPAAETETEAKPISNKDANAASSGIHKFMKNALFGKGTEESEAGLQKEIDQAAKEVAGEESEEPSHTHEDLIRTSSGRVARTS